MINTCCNKALISFCSVRPSLLQVQIPMCCFLPLGSGSHMLFSTSWFTELLQAEKLLPTHHIGTLSTPKSNFADSSSVIFFLQHLSETGSWYSAWKAAVQQGKTSFSKLVTDKHQLQREFSPTPTSWSHVQISAAVYSIPFVSCLLTEASCESSMKLKTNRN